jgi:hypothetical protein
MNRLVLLSTLIIAVLSSEIGFSQDISWSTTTDYDHNCSIKFPGVPTDVYKNTSEGTKYTTYLLYGQSSYFLKILDLKSEPSDKKAKAKKVLNSWATKTKGEVTEESDWTAGSNIGIKGKIEITEEGKPEMLVFCHVIVVGKVQYEIIVMTPKEIYDPEFDGYFLASFRFLS